MNRVPTGTSEDDGERCPNRALGVPSSASAVPSAASGNVG
jgi:hypothetical protein